jgi:hypothetical protein
MLCEVCKDVISRRQGLLTIDTGPANQTIVKCGHHITSSTLALSAAVGCHICQPFWDRCSPNSQEIIRSMDRNVDQDSMASSGITSTNNMTRWNYLTCIEIHVQSLINFEVTLHVMGTSAVWRKLPTGFACSFRLEPCTFPLIYPSPLLIFLPKLNQIVSTRFHLESYRLALFWSIHVGPHVSGSANV